MKYSFSSIAYASAARWLPAYPLKETMKRLSEIGYDGIEVVCVAPHAWPYYLSQEERKEIGVWQKEFGISISSVLPVPGGGAGGNAASACKAERDWTLQYMKDVIDLGHEWGTKTMLYVAGWTVFGTSQKDAWKNTVDTLTKAAEYALDKDITICVENTAADSNLVDTPYDALELMEEVNMPNVGVMFDTFHAFHRQDNPSDYVYIMGKHLKHVHISDYDRKGPGMGGFDFYNVMQALKDVGFSGYVTMEVGFGSRGLDPDYVARKSLDTLKEIEAKLR